MADHPDSEHRFGFECFASTGVKQKDRLGLQHTVHNPRRSFRMAKRSGRWLAAKWDDSLLKPPGADSIEHSKWVTLSRPPCAAAR